MLAGQSRMSSPPPCAEPEVAMRTEAPSPPLLRYNVKISPQAGAIYLNRTSSTAAAVKLI
jgi:hypothetical protein